MSIRLATTRVSSDDTGRLRIQRSWHVDTEDEIFTVASENVSYRGISRSSYDSENWDADTIEGGYRVNITFEGIDQEGPTRSERDNALWNFQPAFEKEPIEKHPAIDQLIDFYDGQIDPETKRVTFPEVYWRGTNSQGPSQSNHWQATGNNRGAANLEKNPLYGMDESGYLAMTGVATCRYNTTNPGQAMDGLGRVFERLPGNAPDYEVTDRDWLKAPPSIDEIGDTDGRRWFAVEERYMLSEKGGWPETVYDFIDL